MNSDEILKETKSDNNCGYVMLDKPTDDIIDEIFKFHGDYYNNLDEIFKFHRDYYNNPDFSEIISKELVKYLMKMDAMPNVIITPMGGKFERICLKCNKKFCTLTSLWLFCNDSCRLSSTCMKCYKCAMKKRCSKCKFQLCSQSCFEAHHCMKKK